MFNNKIINIIVILAILSMSCEEKGTQPTVASEHALGHETANIQDYFYDFDEAINAKYLYYNLSGNDSISLVGSTCIRATAYFDTTENSFNNKIKNVVSVKPYNSKVIPTAVDQTY